MRHHGPQVIVHEQRYVLPEMQRPPAPVVSAPIAGNGSMRQVATIFRRTHVMRHFEASHGARPWLLADFIAIVGACHVLCLGFDFQLVHYLGDTRDGLYGR
jgi:hypothetical protein